MLNKKYFLLLIITLVLLLTGCKKNETVQTTTNQPVKVDSMQEPSIPEETRQAVAENRFADSAPAPLTDVSGGLAEGSAWLLVDNGKTYHRVEAVDLPQLQNNYFYEGWLVREPKEGGFFSTGEITYQVEEDAWVVEYETIGDRSEFNTVVITLEPDDGDPAPAEHILEGKVE